MKNEAPLVSIIMPAYNVERYIEKAICSICKQTFTDWELIIIDDFSSDNTCKVVEGFDDERILLIRRNLNSGSAYIPRSEGLEAARGEWISNIDADDYVENDYFDIMLSAAKRNEVDVCGSQMIIVDEDGTKDRVLVPKEGFQFDHFINDKEIFLMTVPEWKISMNGALIKKSVWIKALEKYNHSGNRQIHDDENLSRMILIEGNGFVATKAKYYLRSNQESVTRRFSLKTFNWQRSNNELIQYAKQEFGIASEEYHSCLLYDYYCYRLVVSNFFHYVNDDQMFIQGLKRIKEWHDAINWDSVIRHDSNVKTKISRSMLLFSIIKALEQPKTLYWKVIWKKTKSVIFGSIKESHRYAWYITRKKREDMIRKRLKEYYNKGRSDCNYRECVLCIYDGAVRAGGLADRLKGIIGSFYIATQKALPFRIYFREPFDLKEYLASSSYDWSIDEHEICKDLESINLIVLDSTQDSNYQSKQQKKYIEKKIKNDGRQNHIYTNASFAYDLDYSSLFQQLFKPSIRLQESIDCQLKTIGENYVSISCRFLDLLGDFNETYGTGRTLSEEEKNELIDRIKNAINNIHKQEPEKRILVNSDSITFLNEISEIDYVYIVPGDITHIDAQQDDHSYEKYEKTFLDFFLIANAEKIYLIKSKEMFKSGFPYAASRVYNKPFEIVEI